MRGLIFATVLLAAVVAAAEQPGDPVPTVRRFFATYADGDLDGLAPFWAASGTAPRAAFERAARGVLRVQCLEIRGLRVDELDVRPDTATARVTLLLTKRERATGREWDAPTVYDFALVRQEGEWRIVEAHPAVEALADRLIAAPSADARRALLAAVPQLVSPELDRQLLRKAYGVFNLPDRDEALRIGAIADEIASSVADTGGTALHLVLRSFVARTEGKWAESRTLALASLDAARKDGEPDVVARALITVGRTYDEEPAGDIRPRFFQEAAMLEDRVEDLSIMVRAANGLEHEAWRRSDYVSLRRHIDDELRLARPIGDRIGEASALLNLAHLYENHRDPRSCIEFAKQAAALYQDTSPGNFYPASLVIEARCREELSQPQASRRLIGRALRITREQKNEHGEADALAELAQHDFLRGAYEAAASEALESAGIYARLGLGTERQYLVLSRARLEQKRYGEALAAAKRFRQGPTGTPPLGILTAKTLEAKAHRAMGDLAAARADIEAALAVGEQLRDLLLGNEQQRAVGIEGAAEAFVEAVDLNVEEGRLEEALACAERAKGRVLLETLTGGERMVTKDMTAEEQQAEERIASELASLNRALVRAGAGEQEALRTRLEQVRLERSSFESSLYSRHPHLQAQRGRIAVASAAQMVAALPEGAAFIEYVLGERRTYAFLVRPGAAVVVRKIPIGRRELEKKVTAYRQRLAGRDLGHRRVARELDALLLEPLLDRLDPSTRDLGIVADGVLWQLPFEALVDRRGRYRLERHTIFYAPSVSIFLEMRRAGSRPRSGRPRRSLLAVGDPLVAAPLRRSLAAVYRGTDLSPLPEARAEVNALRKIYGPDAMVVVGAAATEARVKSEIGDFEVLHFATHGILDDTSPMFSRLVLAEGKDSDGLLEAWELMKLDIGADLVVMSTCDSGRGRVSAGEGMIGMTWAAFVAGARTTVASLWKVDSKSTSTLMVDFHRELHAQPAGPVAKAAALRRAKLHMLRNKVHRHPFYWAAFVTIGDPTTASR